MSDHSPAGFNLSSNSRLIFLVLFSVCRPRLSRQVRYVLSLLRNLYHAFVERVSVFAAWWSTASAVLWPPVGRKWTHHRERGMEYQADILLWGLSNPSEESKCFPQARPTVPITHRALLGTEISSMQFVRIINYIWAGYQETKIRKIHMCENASGGPQCREASILFM